MGEGPDRVVMMSDVVAVRSDLTNLTRRVDGLEQKIGETQALIKEEGETTRRHFTIMVERIETAVKIVAEVNAHHSVVLDNHEKRLNTIEAAR